MRQLPDNPIPSVSHQRTQQYFIYLKNYEVPNNTDVKGRGVLSFLLFEGHVHDFFLLRLMNGQSKIVTFNNNNNINKTKFQEHNLFDFLERYG